jgi:hypothetical protein
VQRILYSFYREVWAEINDSGRRLFAKEPRFSKPKFNNIVVLPILAGHIADLQSEDRLISLSDRKENALYKQYKHEHETALKNATGEWKFIQRAKGYFDKLCGLALTRSHFSTFSTGLVFAGFGEDEIFPSLQHLEIDGLVCGQLKLKKTPVVEIEKLPSGAEVLPFAQHEMVDRFLDGVDPRYDRYLRTSMRRVVQDFGDDLIEKHLSGSPGDKRTARSRMRAARTTLVNEFFRNAKVFKEERFKAGILDMVRFMPKSLTGIFLVNINGLRYKRPSEGRRRNEETA